MENKETTTTLLTKQEAATRLKCSPHTIGRLIKSKKLLAVNVSASNRRNHYRIPETEIEQFIQRQIGNNLKSLRTKRQRRRMRPLKEYIK